MNNRLTHSSFIVLSPFFSNFYFIFKFALREKFGKKTPDASCHSIFKPSTPRHVNNVCISAITHKSQRRLMKKYTSQTTARRRWDTGQDEGNYQGDGTRPLRGIAAIGNMHSTVPNAYTFQQTAALWVRSVTAAASSPAVKQHRRPNIDVGEFNLSVAEDAEVHELHACSGQTGFEDYHNSKRCSSLSDVQWCGLCVLFCLFVCLQGRGAHVSVSSRGLLCTYPSSPTCI